MNCKPSPYSWYPWYCTLYDSNSSRPRVWRRRNEQSIVTLMINWLRLVSLQWNHSHTRLPGSYQTRWTISLNVESNIRYLNRRIIFIVDWRLLSFFFNDFFCYLFLLSHDDDFRFLREKIISMSWTELNICHHKIQHHDQIYHSNFSERGEWSNFSTS